MCQCGCRGWCSLHSLLFVLSWDLTQGSKGVGATARHDGSAFDPVCDSALIQRSGKQLGFATPILQLRGDWPATCELLGFRQWNHTQTPCFICKISRNNLTSEAALNNITCDECPDAWYTRADYDSDVAKFRVEVHVHNLGDRSLIYQNLRYDKIGLGRIVLRDFPQFGLLAGDRLLPSFDILDVSAFERRSCPFIAQFWRIGKESRLVYPSPVMSIPGFGVHLYGIDLLHAWHLGPLQNYIGMVFWFLIQTNIWKPEIAWLSKDQQYRLSLLHLKSEMWQYYEMRRREDEHFVASGSQVATLKCKMRQVLHITIFTGICVTFVQV